MSAPIYPFFISHAGCPHRCLFCRQPAVNGRDRIPEPGEIAANLAGMLRTAGAGEVAFYGGTFTLLDGERQRAYLKAVRPFRDSGRVTGVRVSTRPDALASSQVDLLREEEVGTVEIGCQSFCDRALAASGRGHGSGAADEAVRRLRQAGLRVGLQLMPGLPGAAPGEGRRSLVAALALRPDFLRIYPTVVLRGSGLEGVWRAGGYQPLSLGAAVRLCAELLWRCRKAGVPVIRLGLQAGPELDSGGELLAGPYHPAFGQMVRSHLWLRALWRIGRGRATVRVHPADLGDALGQRRSNLHRLRRRNPTFDLRSDPQTSRETVLVEGRGASLLDLAAYPESPSGWQKQ